MADEKLIFPIGFDLEEGVKKAGRDWKNHYRKRLQDTMDSRPLKVKIDFESKGIDTKEFKQWMALSREAEKLERERIKNAKEWQKVADQAAMAETRRANATNESNARIERANRKAEASERRKKDAVERTNAAYRTQSGYLQRLFQRMVAYASVAQAFSFIRNIRDVTAEFELQRVALGSIIGDLNEANAMFEQIKAAAVKSPFQIKELVTYTKQLAAYKIESDELFETTQRLADISAGLGVSMDRLVLAYGQIRATGYLRASEVRQLTEAGIPIVEELAKKMSQLRGETVSAAEVMGLISERAISFGMVKEVFDDMTSAGGMFYKMQEKQAETLRGQWSNLQDSIAIMYEEIGNTESVNNAMKGMIGLIKSLAENWRDVWSVVQSLSVAMGVYYVAMKSAAVASKALSVAEATRLSTLKATTIYMPKFLASTKLATTLTHAYRVAVIKSATATSILSKAFWGLTKAMLSNPYTAILAALAGLATLLLTVESRAKRLSKELSKIGKDGAIQIDQSARNFERLAKAIRESEEGSEKQTAALAELKRSYGELLPSQDKEIKALVQEKANYDSLIKSIKRKIELQIQEQKINKIASEYGSRISTAEDDFKGLLTQYGLTEEDADRVTDATKKAIDEGLISAQKSAKENARELSRILEEETGLTKLKDYFDPMDVFTERYGKKMRNQFASLVEVVSEYNTEIDKVGGALDKLDDKGKNLSDTFNTWQKELASITEGKNLKGEGIRVFDDESISQINKLTDATARVAEEYDKLAKEKEEVDKVLKSEGAKADKDTYAKLQERLGKINEGMSGLYAFLKKYGGLDLITEDDKDKSDLSILQKELQLHEKIYAKYKEYRKYMSDEQAKAKVEDYFGDTIKSLMFEPKYDSQGFKQVLKQYQDYARTLPESEKVVLDIGFKVADIDWQDTKTELENNLKKLSDDLSRTKAAKEFFDRMLGLTGDKQLSATLTLSVYGEGGENLGQKLAKQTIDGFKKKYKGVDFSDEAISKQGFFDWTQIKKDAEKALKDKKIGEDVFNDLMNDIKAGEKQSSSRIESLMKELEITKKYSEKLVTIYQNTQNRINEINQTTPEGDVKNRLIEQSNELQAKQIAKLQYDTFKDSPMYVAMFENLDTTSTSMLTNMRDHILKLKSEWKNLNPTELKELQSRINEIDDLLAKRSPFKGLIDAIKALRTLQKGGTRDDAEKELLEASKERAQAEKRYTEALASKKPENEIKSLGVALDQAIEKEKQATVAVQDWDDALGNLSSSWDALKQYVEIASSITSAISDVVEAFGGWGDVADEEFWNTMIDGINGLLDGISSIGSGVVLSMINPLLGLPSIISGIGSVFSSIGNLFYAGTIRRANKEIERQQEILDNLTYAYERLEKVQEKVFGAEYISNYEQRLASLYAQQEAYLKQAEAERSKGKKADEEKIKGYEEQARETADAIADMQSEVAERLSGTDVASAARDFAQSWIEAYAQFGNTTDAISEKFKDMIQNMIVESLAAKVMQTMLEPIFNEIDRLAQEGGEFSVQDAASIAAMANEESGKMNEAMLELMHSLESAGITVRDMGSGLTGISKDIATASEESILGLAAGINTQNFYISQVPAKLDAIISLMRGGSAVVDKGVNVQDLITLQNQFLSSLPSIAQNTADTVARCERAAIACERMASQLDRVIQPRGTQATHTVNIS